MCSGRRKKQAWLRPRLHGTRHVGGSGTCSTCGQLHCAPPSRSSWETMPTCFCPWCVPLPTIKHPCKSICTHPSPQAFIQILKAFTPACTFALGVLLGIETPRAVQIVSVTAIAVGTCVSTLIERGTPTFHWLGFSAFMASVFTEAARVLVVQRLMATGGVTPSHASWLLGLPTAALLAAASAVWEARSLLAGGHLALLWRNSRLFTCAIAGSCALNWLSYLAIRSSGALTLKIVGCVKNVLVVWVGVLQGEHVGLGELGGYALSLAGFVLYSVAGTHKAKVA